MKYMYKKPPSIRQQQVPKGKKRFEIHSEHSQCVVISHHFIDALHQAYRKMRADRMAIYTETGYAIRITRKVGSKGVYYLFG